MNFRKMLVKIKDRIFREEGYLTEIKDMLENLFIPKLENFSAEDLYRNIDIEYHQVSRNFFFYIDGENICTYAIVDKSPKKLDPFDTLLYVLKREGIYDADVEEISDEGDYRITFNLFFII